MNDRIASLGIEPLHVQADLRVSVDGVQACIVSDGSRVTVSTSADPPALVLAARAQLTGPGSGSLRRSTGFAGELLDGAGLSVRIVAPRGTLVELGHGCSSSIGRILLGSDYARLGRARVVLPHATAYVRQSPLLRPAAVVAAAVTLLTIAARRARRRTSNP